MSYTKGPWRVQDEFILAGGEGRGGRVIAMNHDRVHYECEPENLANANLMESAPDLLEFAKRVAYRAQVFCKLQGINPESIADYREAIELIKQVEGGE